MGTGTSEVRRTESFDEIAAELRALREQAGPVSFAEIVRRISEQRLSRGVHEAAAAPPRSTVYNAFSEGRARLDTELIREIVLALGADEAAADDWVERCRTAQRTPPTQEAAAETATGRDPRPTHGTPAARTGAGTLTAPHPSTEPHARTAHAPAAAASLATTYAPAAPLPAPPAAPPAARPADEHMTTADPSLPAAVAVDSGPILLGLPDARPRTGAMILILLICLAMNAVGDVLVRVLGLPLYLDMAGTAIAATALGPWFGAFVAVTTNVAAVVHEDHDFLFALVGITGALVWGYGVRRFHMGDTFGRFFTLGVIVAVSCSLVATPVLVLKHGGSYGLGQTNVTDQLLAVGVPLLLSVFTVNIVTSLLDKLLATYTALAMLPFLHRRFGISVTHIPLVLQLQGPRTPRGTQPASAGAGGGAGASAESGLDRAAP